jgi:integral membrane protein
MSASADSRVAGRRTDATAIGAALLRFRVVAYVVGVGLITLVFVAMPLRYFGGMPAASKTISPIHGLMYMVYLALTFDLATRCGFTAKRTVLIMLAGTVPFLSFVAERKVSALVRAAPDRPR